jgi:hypothetical protein
VTADRDTAAAGIASKEMSMLKTLGLEGDCTGLSRIAETNLGTAYAAQTMADSAALNNDIVKLAALYNMAAQSRIKADDARIAAEVVVAENENSLRLAELTAMAQNASASVERIDGVLAYISGNLIDMVAERIAEARNDGSTAQSIRQEAFNDIGGMRDDYAEIVAAMKDNLSAAGVQFTDAEVHKNTLAAAYGLFNATGVAAGTVTADYDTGADLFERMEALHTDGASVVKRGKALRYVIEMLDNAILKKADNTVSVELMRSQDGFHRELKELASLMDYAAAAESNAAMAANKQEFDAILATSAGMANNSALHIVSSDSLKEYNASYIGRAAAVKDISKRMFEDVNLLLDPDDQKAMALLAGRISDSSSAYVNEAVTGLEDDATGKLTAYGLKLAKDAQDASRMKALDVRREVALILGARDHGGSFAARSSAARASASAARDAIIASPTSTEAQGHMYIIDGLYRLTQDLAAQARELANARPEDSSLQEAGMNVLKDAKEISVWKKEAEYALGITSSVIEDRLVDMIMPQDDNVAVRVRKAVLGFFQQVLDVYTESQKAQAENQTLRDLIPYYQPVISALSAVNPALLNASGIAELGAWLGAQQANIINCAASVLGSYLEYKDMREASERIASAAIIEDMLARQVLFEGDLATSLYALAAFAAAKGINMVGAEVDNAALGTIDTPFIATVRREGIDHAVLVTEVTDTTVRYLSNDIIFSDTLSDFNAMYLGKILIAENDIRERIDSGEIVTIPAYQLKAIVAAWTPDPVSYADMFDFGAVERAVSM